jgi:hypothetical protein
MRTNNSDRQAISMIVARHRGEMSLREFAAKLTDKMPEPISHQSIKNWEDGTTEPPYYLMLAIALHNDDWRRQMALEILQVLKPRFYTPDQLKIIP